MEDSSHSQCPYGCDCPHVGRKSRIVYILLGLFLGGFGIHNFYAGYTGKACLQLLLTFTGIGFPIVVIWVILDIIFVKQDANRVPFVSGFFWEESF